MLAPWRKNYDQPRQHVKKQRHYFANKGPSSQGYGFSSGHGWMWELDCKESRVLKNWCFWTVVLEKTYSGFSINICWGNTFKVTDIWAGVKWTAMELFLSWLRKVSLPNAYRDNTMSDLSAVRSICFPSPTEPCKLPASPFLTKVPSEHGKPTALLQQDILHQSGEKCFHLMSTCSLSDQFCFQRIGAQYKVQLCRKSLCRWLDAERRFQASFWLTEERFLLPSVPEAENWAAQ